MRCGMRRQPRDVFVSKKGGDETVSCPTCEPSAWDRGVFGPFIGPRRRVSGVRVRRLMRVKAEGGCPTDVRGQPTAAGLGRGKPIADPPPVFRPPTLAGRSPRYAARALLGCPQCVRVVYERHVQHGASERMVVTAPATRPTPSCTSRAGNPDIPCQRTIATSTAIGWKGGRYRWRVSPWRVP
jgi:hypothetical protein